MRQLAPMLGRHAPRSPLLLRLAATAGVTVESVSRLGVKDTAFKFKKTDLMRFLHAKIVQAMLRCYML